MSDPTIDPINVSTLTTAGGTAGITPQAPAKVEMTSDALTARLAEERAKGSAAARAALLKDLGIEDAKDGKALLAAAKAKADAELSEAQRLAKTIEELTPKAKRAEALEKQLEALVAVQFDALPEGTRAAIDEVAQGNAEERLRMIGVFRKAGFIDAPAPPAAEKTKLPAATTSPASPPKAGTAQTKYDEWQAFVTAGRQTAADLFFQYNRSAIEKSRPADQ